MLGDVSASTLVCQSQTYSGRHVKVCFQHVIVATTSGSSVGAFWLTNSKLAFPGFRCHDFFLANAASIARTSECGLKPTTTKCSKKDVDSFFWCLLSCKCKNHQTPFEWHTLKQVSIIYRVQSQKQVLDHSFHNLIGRVCTKLQDSNRMAKTQLKSTSKVTFNHCQQQNCCLVINKE